MPIRKLQERFPRTQNAIRIAAPLADMALMFDNSRTLELSVSLARVQLGREVLYDCRDNRRANALANTAKPWLDIVAPAAEGSARR